MGLRKESIRLLMQEGLRSPFQGAIVTLGRQDVWTTLDELKTLAKQLNYPLTSTTLELSHKSELRDQNYISDRTLFSMLGFSRVVSTDASSYENADFILDLNQDALPSDYKERFDIVLDPGTIEHVFHVPNSLKNIFQMLKVGGRVIHISPSSNHLDHGFYMFSPTLFWDYYSANQFDMQKIQIIKYRPQWIFPWKIAPYKPGAFNSFSFGGLDGAMYAVYCIASKTAHSTCHKVPQQHNFEQNLWKQPQTLLSQSMLKQWIKKSPSLYRLSSYFLRFFKRKQLNRQFQDL